jgi:hypothetical protein
MGKRALALLLQLDAACEAVDDLAQATKEAFRSHRDATIMLSFPWLVPRPLPAFWARSATFWARSATRPDLVRHGWRVEGVRRIRPPLITGASGKRRYVGRRFVKNNRLHHVGHPWAFVSLSGSSCAGYRRWRIGGDWHMQALRHLLNRLLGRLHHCLQARCLFDEASALPADTVTGSPTGSPSPAQP